MSKLVFLLGFGQASVCAAGESASHSYHRTAAFGDDVVIVA